jgi:hypothetical protein
MFCKIAEKEEVLKPIYAHIISVVRFEITTALLKELKVKLT